MSDFGGQLLAIAADLVRGFPGLSEFPEDNPKTTPRRILVSIEQAQQWARNKGADISALVRKFEGQWLCKEQEENRRLRSQLALAVAWLDAYDGLVAAKYNPAADRAEEKAREAFRASLKERERG